MISLDRGEYSCDPYANVLWESVLESEFSSKLIEWMKKDAPWALKETDFYQQHEFSFLSIDESVPNWLKVLYSEDTLLYLRSCLEAHFEVVLAERTEVTAHRLTAGQVIKIHNDYIPGQETHRLLIQVNTSWCEEKGGLLMLFGSSSASDLKRIILPVSGSAFAFAISEESHHAVSRIVEGERYTLVYSFYET